MSSADRWNEIYNQTPLVAVPSHYAGMTTSAFLYHYLVAVLKLTPAHGRTLETGIGSGYGAIWLSLRGIEACGIDYSPEIVERAKQVNLRLGGHATFEKGDLFDLYTKNAPRYDVIHHQGVLEHFTVPQIKAALAQQVACADHVVFSVPSVNYPFTPEFGNERLLPLAEWERILAPFDIEELKYYGDPKLGAEEQILCTLRGQKADSALLDLMHPFGTGFRPGVSAIVHTRNEALRLRDCLDSLKGWADQIIVCDMESDDGTVTIAAEFTSDILHHPKIPNFDQARNASAMRAEYEWVFYLDADERAPKRLGEELKRLALSRPSDFDAMLIPFRHHFSGHWMQSMYPGYTAPRLLRNGKFIFNPRLHSGAQVDGIVTAFPANDPELALVHYSFDSLHHYLDKLNNYTDGESLNMHRDGQLYHWQNSVSHFVHDFKSYYENGNGKIDGVHGFLYAFQSAFYRFFQHGKLFERRDKSGQVTEWERAVPASMEEMLEFALKVCRQKPRLVKQPVTVSENAEAAIVWTGPVFDQCGYGDESRNLALALTATPNANIAIQSLPWGAEAAINDADQEKLTELARQPALPQFTQIIHTFGANLPAERDPNAGLAIGRTIFETDRLPKAWVDACNTMDAVWAASEFNRKTFADAGVDPQKIAVIPECLDARRYLALPTKQQVAASPETPEVIRDIAGSDVFSFLSIFDWTLHKGWDVLLRGFLTEFQENENVRLVLKVWSSNGYAGEQITEQAAHFAKSELGVDLMFNSRIKIVQQYFTEDELRSLYLACDSYVLPSRGEGWGRPFMEAMACGLPTIGTGWGGNTKFMSANNSYLIDSALVPVPEQGWREVTAYKGHRWAEPDLNHLKASMRRVYERPEEAAAIGGAARAHILATYSREAVGPLIAKEIQKLVGSVSTAAMSASAPVPTLEGRGARVRWEGAIMRQHSLGHVNRQLCLALLDGGTELSIIPTEPADISPDTPGLLRLTEASFAPLSGPADVHVRHAFPPVFSRPDEGDFVLMQPWEYGYLPRDWVAKIEEMVTEVWCNSRYVMDVYKNSGVPEEKLALTPLGVDTALFNSEALPYIFTDEPGAERLYRPGSDPFVFLYVGGTIERKGFDTLLDAYLKGFSAYDNVVLVIKASGTKTVYRDNDRGDELRALAADTSRPRIIYVEEDLSPREMAGIYSGSNCLVAPYRGEGFCLPVLEAMACGVPSIVTGGGSTDDFIDDETGWRLPAKRAPFGNGRVGEWECAGPTWMFEVSAGDLAQQMRSAASDRAECKRRGDAGAVRAKASWCWRRSAAIIAARIAALKERPRIHEKQTRAAARPAVAAPNVSLSKKSAKSAKTGKRRTSISLCMIVKNEERVLGDCLTSIKPWVDEIIVVDTGSSDRTAEIAREHGAKVHQFPWTQSFSAARNESLKYATGDWILWMDADDTIPPECGAALHDTVLLSEEKVTGLMMQVRIPPAPGEVGQTVVDHVKLFRNGLGLQFEGRIHEQILEPIYRIGGEIRRTEMYVIHSGYDYSQEGQKGKRARDLALLDLDLTERPDHPFVLFNIGMTAFHMKDFPKAVAALEKCLALSKPTESTVRKVYAMLAGCALETGDLVGARRWIEQGLSLYPRDPELLFRGGIVYKETGNLARAEECYLMLLDKPERGHIDSVDTTMTGFKAHHNLALVYADMGDAMSAKRHFGRALELQPGFSPSQTGLEMCVT